MVVRRPSGPSRTPTATPDGNTGRVTVPKLNQDPVQSLRPYSIIVSVEGEDFEIPAMTAADWLGVLMTPDWELLDVFPGLLPEHENYLLASQLSVEEFTELGTSIIATASARSWWVALRLIEVARGSWDVVGGELALKGIDATQLSLSSWLDVLLLILLRNMDQKDIPMFTMRLELPPEGFQAEAEEPTMSAQEFMAMAG